MQRNSRILIVGHNDSVDNSLLAYFIRRGFSQIRSNVRDKIDVLSQAKVDTFFKKFKPEHVFLGSVRSGGIVANQQMPAEFIYENCQAQNNIIHASYVNGVKKLLYFTGSCAYPAKAQQPIKESSLLTGSLEASSEAYSVAKIAGTKMCQAYRTQYGFNAIVAVPATLYGPGSDTDIQTAHVMGALIAKFAKAVKEGLSTVEVWGSGKPRREFVYVDDFVSACIFLMDKYNGADLVNIGCGSDISIKQLALLLKKISGFKGRLVFDASKPDGTMRKLMDNKRILKLGWKPKVALEQGIRATWQDFVKQ